MCSSFTRCLVTLVLAILKGRESIAVNNKGAYVGDKCQNKQECGSSISLQVVQKQWDLPLDAPIFLSVFTSTHHHMDISDQLSFTVPSYFVRHTGSG